MADITMCHGGDCPKKNKCYRYKAMPEEQLQTYFISPPYSKGQCRFYWHSDCEDQHELVEQTQTC